MPAAVPIPEIAYASDAELAAMRYKLTEEVQIYRWRADMEGPNPHRDATSAVYEAFLVLVDDERRRRERPILVRDLIAEWCAMGRKPQPAGDAHHDFPHALEAVVASMSMVVVHTGSPAEMVA